HGRLRKRKGSKSPSMKRDLHRGAQGALVLTKDTTLAHYSSRFASGSGHEKWEKIKKNQDCENLCRLRKVYGRPPSTLEVLGGDLFALIIRERKSAAGSAHRFPLCGPTRRRC